MYKKWVNNNMRLSLRSNFQIDPGSKSPFSDYVRYLLNEGPSGVLEAMRAVAFFTGQKAIFRIEGLKVMCHRARSRQAKLFTILHDLRSQRHLSGCMNVWKKWKSDRDWEFQYDYLQSGEAPSISAEDADALWQELNEEKQQKVAVATVIEDLICTLEKEERAKKIEKSRNAALSRREMSKKRKLEENWDAEMGRALDVHNGWIGIVDIIGNKMPDRVLKLMWQNGPLNISQRCYLLYYFYNNGLSIEHSLMPWFELMGHLRDQEARRSIANILREFENPTARTLKLTSWCEHIGCFTGVIDGKPVYRLDPPK